MKIVLATGNMDKVKEIKEFYKEYEIYALDEILPPIEMIENGISFKENALIKSRNVYQALKERGLDKEFISLSDDSGISVDVLNSKPGIYSARYSGKNATDASNRAKLIKEIKTLNLSNTKAYYTACIAISSKFGDFTTHGYMHGVVIDEERGKNGFGYDFMFIPNGFDKTIAELDRSLKMEISHRSKGLELMRYILKILEKNYLA
ncbi:MAG: RdgB/HAM1 family non-canonical purine NTP pyrophosphatase [Campylobacter sp.]|nr:RdgB/HAM1 family non-canonical purine NTP pyrophosphatase [Campylobacter sp.]